MSNVTDVPAVNYSDDAINCRFYIKGTCMALQSKILLFQLAVDVLRISYLEFKLLTEDIEFV